MGDARRIVGITGSLRSGSLNRRLLENAADLAPTGLRVEAFDLREVPPYDQDRDGDDKPAPVLRLKAAIRAADGVLVATPEHNYGMPGVLKNALDWASRPGFRSPFRDKPVAVVSASPALAGGARAQQAVKLTLLGMAAAVLPWPELALSRAGEAFDAQGKLADASVREKLGELMEGFARWVDALDAYGENARPVAAS